MVVEKSVPKVLHIMPRVSKFGRGKEKRTYSISFPQRKRTKTAGSEELGCSSEESAVGLQNGINVHISEDKIMPPCVTPDKIDDGTEVNVGGVIKETVIKDTVINDSTLG